ncbi:MAG: hypothetical protein ACT4P6_13475 [Gemmatimonadaceae bacterium]
MSRLSRLAVAVICLAGCHDELSLYESRAAAFIDSLYESGADTVYVLNVQQTLRGSRRKADRMPMRC